MRSKRIFAAGAVIATLSLVATACGSDGGDGGSDSGDSAQPVVVRGGQPQNPLVPGNTGESNGHDIVELFTSTLYRYDAATSEPKADLAESVQTSDNQNFTVRIKKGVKFHDGTEVKAKNFVDAWNYTAAGVNAQYLSYFYEPIEGFADTQCPETDEEGACVGKAKTDKLTGLTVVDDHTFTIKTTEPVSNLPVRLGYTAFAPLPDAFFADPKAFEAKPIGAGPYEVVKYEPGKSTDLKQFADYGGDAAKGNVENITFRMYDEAEAAYNDLLAGNLDLIDDMPTSALVGEKYKTDLGERWDQEPYPAIQTVSFPPADVNPAYSNPDLRHAISMAIDREKVIKDQFEGARVPADSWGAPGIEGFNEGTCGEFCTFDADKAKALFAKAGGFKGGKLSITTNADSDHKGWMTSACNSIRSVLGVDCVATLVPDFATFRDKIGNGTMKTMFRAGWVQDYPHIENFLTPLYGTGAASNDGKYSNPAFDAKLVEAAKASDEESLALYKEAEEMLAPDMPSIPMWYYTATIGWSDKVTDVRVSQASGRPDLFSMKQK